MFRRLMLQSFLDEVRAGRYGSLIGMRGPEKYNALQKAAMEGCSVPLLIGHDMVIAHNLALRRQSGGFGEGRTVRS